MQSDLVRCSLMLIVTGALGFGQSISISEPLEQNGMIVVSVRNGYKSPITGLLIEATLTNQGQRKFVASQYLDIFVNAFHDKAIGAGEQHQIPLVSAEMARRMPPSVSLSGALFEDGTRFGSERGIRILVGRRHAVREALTLLRGNMSNAKGGNGVALDAVVESIARNHDAESKQAKNDDLVILGARTQVVEWVRGALRGAPPDCDAGCFARRVDYIVGGLDIWGGEIEKGLARFAK